MKTEQKENIYITWHYTTHGIAYLKHILSAFYAKIVSPEKVAAEKISQLEMNEVFYGKKDGFLFNKVYLLTAPQETFDRISARRFTNKDEILKNDELFKNNPASKIWEKIINNPIDGLENQIEYVNKKYDKTLSQHWESQLWRQIQHYTIEDQILWFRKYSKIPANYKNSEIFNVIELKIKDLRNSVEIALNLKPFLEKIKSKHPDSKIIINSTLGTSETQVVWQIFGELDLLPTNSTLISTYDNKTSNKEQRFKEFDIKEIPSKIISEFSKSLKLYDTKPVSESGILAELKMQNYIKSGFSVFLLGERGIGKSRLAEKYKADKQFIAVNCASFDDDSKAESELFGYVKGAFTGADSLKKGLFEEADNGILFMDEIHSLSKRVQSKLMKALQTDDNNNIRIRSLGDNKEKVLKISFIFASNLTIEELHLKLMPDFYDRITQLVIELPPLRNIRADIPKAFENIWKQMKFETVYKFNDNVKEDNLLFDWLKTLNLFGNYRDLQRIAIYYKTFLAFLPDIKNKIQYKTAFLFAKNEFENYQSKQTKTNITDEIFEYEKTAEQMIDEFKQKLAIWAIENFKSASNAAEHFKKNGGKTTKETLYNWKNS